jgi:hypothetical protein
MPAREATRDSRCGGRMSEIQKTQMRAVLDRADRLIQWMTGYIGQMAPGKYQDCFSDLNEHGLFMKALKRAERQAGITDAR